MVARGGVDLARASENGAENKRCYDAAHNSFEQWMRVRRSAPVPPLSEPWRSPGGSFNQRALPIRDREDNNNNSNDDDDNNNIRNKLAAPRSRACGAPPEDGGGGGRADGDVLPTFDHLEIGGEGTSFEFLVPADRRGATAFERSSGASPPGGSSSSAANSEGGGGGGGGGGDPTPEQQRADEMHELEQSMPKRPPYGGYRPCRPSGGAIISGRKAKRPTRNAAAPDDDPMTLDAPVWRSDNYDSVSSLLFRSGSVSGGGQAGALDGFPGPASGSGGGSTVVANSGVGGGSCWAAPHLVAAHSGKGFAAPGDIGIGNKNNISNTSKDDLHLYRQQSFDPQRGSNFVDRILCDDGKSQSLTSIDFISGAAAAAATSSRDGVVAGGSAGLGTAAAAGGEKFSAPAADDQAGAKAWGAAAAAAAAARGSTTKLSAENNGAYNGYGSVRNGQRSPPSSRFDYGHNVPISPASSSSSLPGERRLPIPRPPAPVLPTYHQGKRRYNQLAMLIPVPDISKFVGGSSSRPTHGAGQSGPAGHLAAREGLSPSGAAAAVQPGGGDGAPVPRTRQDALDLYRQKKPRRAAAFWRWKNDPELKERSKSRARPRDSNGRFQGGT